MRIDCIDIYRIDAMASAADHPTLAIVTIAFPASCSRIEFYRNLRSRVDCRVWRAGLGECRFPESRSRFVFLALLRVVVCIIADTVSTGLRSTEIVSSDGSLLV